MANQKTLRESAKTFESKKTGNIADLEAVSLDSVFEDRKGKDESGKEFNYSVILILGEEYRVPQTVLNQIKTIMEAKPSLKTIKVIRKGTGMNTSYQVIPLE